MTGQIIGKYRVEERIGRGGMGTVYRAIDETLRRDVALKVLNAELNDPEVARRFRAEAVTVARLSHPGIATIYELFQHDGQWLMVMEFVRGETLERLVGRAGPLPVSRVADLCMQALAALSHAHGMGVVHRDLKPANLMINETGVVKVMDFGIARVSGAEHLTNAGFMMGTPAYMAPEQVMGAEVDARADLYAMGVVFYRLVTGKLPFKGDTAFAMAQSQVNDPPTPVMTARPDVPPWVEMVVGRALAKAPEARYQSAVEFHETLGRSLAGMPVAIGDGSAPTELMATPTRTPLGIPTLSNAPASAQVLAEENAPVAAPAAPPSKAAAAPVRKANTAVAVLVAVAALVLIAVAGRFWLGSQQAASAPVAPVAAPATTPAPPPEGAPTPTGAVAGGAQPTTDTATPPPVSPQPPPVPPPAPPPSSVAKSAPATTPRTGPAAARGDAGKAAKPEPVAVPSADAKRGTAPPPAPAPAVDDSLVAFGNIKILAVNGRRTTDRDVLINFGGGRMSVMSRDGGGAIAAVPYPRVRRATFVVARDPKWDPALPAPPADLDVGSFMRQSRPWLVVQTADEFLILRLEDRTAPRLLQTLEERAGIKVDRPASGGK